MGERQDGAGPERLLVWTRRAIEQPDLRVSTAERSAVADSLSQHYADGRLDASEFDERLGRAMAAKTQADLSGLLCDLPGPGALRPASASRPRRPRLLSSLVLGILLAVVVSAAISAITAPHLPWVLIAAVVIWALWRRRAGRGDRALPARR